MTLNKAIDTEGTDDIVCPHCGYRHGGRLKGKATNRWQDGECFSCQKPFRYRYKVTVTYDTEKIT